MAPKDVTRAKILGAGSIGNHLAHAARRLGWHVDLCDIDPAALKRTRESIYPSRYNTWDPAINLFVAGDAPKGGYDFILVGTPPDSHMALAHRALDEKPRAILVEKPLCAPDLKGAADLLQRARAEKVAVFTGYDHVVSAGIGAATQLAASGHLGRLQTIDVEFREHWGGIFAAHPWLDGPADTYLGYWKRGGGAASEHSHALNLWQHFAHALGEGRVTEVSAMLDYVDDGSVCYDRLCLVQMRTDGGLCGRVVQDTITLPPRKCARLQGSEGYIEWRYDYGHNQEAVLYGRGTEPPKRRVIEKTRADDFIQELRHLAEATNSGEAEQSPIALERGLETMLAIAAVHRAAQCGAAVRINYDNGYTTDALIDG